MALRFQLLKQALAMLYDACYTSKVIFFTCAHKATKITIVNLLGSSWTAVG